MDKFFDTFTKTSIEKKIGILIGLLLLVAGIDYFAVMAAQFEEKAALTEQNESMQVQLLDKQQKAKDLTGFKREVERLRQRLREAEEQLPKKSEIPKLLKDINYEGQQSGLTISRFELQGEQQQGAFAAVPVKMTVEGNYHEIAVFLDRIAKLPRIVNVTNIALGTPGEQNKKIVLKGSYTATTYRFLETGGGAQPGKGAQPAKQAAASSDD